MSILPIELMWARAEQSRKDGSLDFDELLYVGEAIFKTYVAGIVAAVADDPTRQRYKLMHKLVRGSGLGDWDEVLSEVSTGLPVQQLLPSSLELHHELTARYGPGSWMHDAVTLLQTCITTFLPGADALPAKFDGRKWFSQFVYLRNKTRGHGAPTEDQKAAGSLVLETSLRLISDTCALFRREWVYLRRNLSNKYNVTPLGASSRAFDYLKGDKSISLSDGVYVYFGAPARVDMIESTVDLVDFFYPNGHFGKKKMEWLSYVSNTRQDVDATAYLAPASALPASHTQGDPSMRTVGRCFANVPPLPRDYIQRKELESELASVLSNDRHPVVTLVGRGGVGKTSLALHVLHHLAESEGDRFYGIVWLSARDIDLLPSGAKLVKPSVLSVKDIAREIVQLLQPAESSEKTFDREKYVAGVLRSFGQDALLFVFDNFETVQQPLDVFNWLDQNIRLPNKILITTRHRDFRGDYAVEVGGMTERQCNELVRSTSTAIGMQGMATDQFCRDIYRESEGHPYVAKILVGEAVDKGRFRKVERVMAGKEEILDALFDRTYKGLTPASRRVFLTLCGWRSVVPAVALEAALLRPEQEHRIDSQSAMDELKRVSFVDEFASEADGSIFFSVPSVAAVFGKRKLSVSQDRISIEEDTRFIQRFGAMLPPEVKLGLAPRVQRLFASLSEELDGGNLNLDKEAPILELIARQHTPAWLLISRLWTESGKDVGSVNTKAALFRYLEAMPDDLNDRRAAWQRVADLSRKERDWLGFVNALVQTAELPDSSLATISGVVNTFNSVNRELEADPDQRRAFARRLVAVMEPKIADGNATDCSRLGWLFLQTGNQSRALEIVQCGLRLDEDNEHCRKLESRLSDVARPYGPLFQNS